MKFTKMIALSLAAVSLLALTSCGKKVCDVCKADPPTQEVKVEKRKVDLCDYCYQKLVLTETDVDVEMIKETEFGALTDAQKNYIIIYVEERIGYYNAMFAENLNDELISKACDEAAAKYEKTADEVKALFETRGIKGNIQ